MELAFSLLIGIFFAVAIYLLLSPQIIRMLMGVVILGNAVNLMIFTSGRLTREVPPIVPDAETIGSAAMANPLPQALVLTAIVISFAFFAFLLTLAYRSFQELGTDDTDKMHEAEPRRAHTPPIGY